MSQIMERVTRIVMPLAAIQVENVTEKTRIVDDLDVSSADVVEIVLALEEEFDIEIPDEEASGLETIGDVCELVVRKTAGGSAGGAAAP